MKFKQHNPTVSKSRSALRSREDDDEPVRRGGQGPGSVYFTGLWAPHCSLHQAVCFTHFYEHVCFLYDHLEVRRK